MATILCIETSTTNCSVALSVGGKCVAIREENNGYTHAENITVFIEDVIQSAGITINDLNAVAVSKGPGSYTGLRIGVSAAKGICFGKDIPLISVNTLHAMALREFKQNDPAPTFYCPMIDARRMEVYCAVYDSSGGEQQEIDAVIIDGASFLEFLSKGSVLFFGDGAMKCRETISHANARFKADVFPGADAMCNIAEDKFVQNNFEDLSSFEPFYLKDFIAGKGSVPPVKN